MWEAMAFASYYQLDNLVAIIDVNRLGQSEAAPLQHDMEAHRKRCEAFGSVPNFLHFNLISYETLGCGLIIVVICGMLLKLSHVCVGGTRILWMAMMWRSCAKLYGKLSKSRANPLALLQRHSRAKDSKVSVAFHMVNILVTDHLLFSDFDRNLLIPCL